MSRLKLVFAAILILFCHYPVLAGEPEQKAGQTEKDAIMDDIVVTGKKEDAAEAPAGAKVPAVVNSTTKSELKKITVLTTDDALRYNPGMYLRKLYPGGSIPLSIRGTYPFSPQTLVQADGIRLSDYTSSGNTRWSQIAPEEIERVDVIYGPYSAMYSGHTLGGVALITTSLPEKMQVIANASYMYQNFKAYESDYDLDGYQNHFSFGDKFGNFRVFGLFERIENEGQPISFNTLLADNGGAAAGNAVAGYDSDHDFQNRKRFIIGDQGTRDITDTTCKLKFGYDLDSNTQLNFQWVHWWSDQNVDNVNTYLTDAAGNKVYSGSVNVAGLNYNIGSSTFYFQENQNEGDVYAIAFKREPEAGLKIRVDSSFNNNWKALSKRSTDVPPYSKWGGAGTVTDSETGWYNFDFKSAYKPLKWSAVKDHTLTAGYHFDHYFTDSKTWNASDWKSEIKTTLNDKSEGKTGTHAVFLQDEWDITDKIMVYFGGRYEWWRGFDGIKARDVSGSVYTTELPDRKEDHFSPKFAVAYNPDTNWGFRFSLAKAYRFPTIRELFYANVSSAGIVTLTNPDLKSEKIFAKDFTISKKVGWAGEARLSFFENYTEDTIFSQTDVYKNQTYYQNIDEVRTRGVEFQFKKKGLFVDRLDAMFNIAYMKAKTLKNDNLPDSEGKIFPRAPKWTSKAVVSCFPTDKLFLTLAGRYSSKAWNTLNNVDDRGGYGGVDDYFFLDAKVAYKLLKQVTISLSVDNLTDELVYMYHPYARQMIIAKLKWEY
uniref:TonB-dependent receptor n=3 Tax=Desulfobacterium TaxID=2295 RepID=E1YMW6_9BACT|nr:hypothetical protein N47_O13290 [uncultured Desulfobacterium sp.]